MIIPDSKIWTSDPKETVVRGFRSKTDYPQKREFSGENGFPDAPAKVRGLGQLVGQSDAMLQLYELIEAVAVSTANVIIGGESGTGKELVAQALHTRSWRSFVLLPLVFSPKTAEAILLILLQPLDSRRYHTAC